MEFEFEKVAIMYNSRAGDGRSYQWAVVLKNMLDKQTQNGAAIVNVETSPYKNNYHAAFELANKKYQLLVAIGGDGTINQVASGIMDSGYPTVLGILPAGSINNFSQALNIPQSPKLATENILSGQPVPVDIGKVNDTYMVSSMALGVLADIAENVTYKDKRAFGPFAFLKNAFRVIRKNKSYRLFIDYGDGKRYVKTKILLVSMTNSIGGFKDLNPKVKTDDGLFHVYSLSDVRLWKAILLLPKILKGPFSELPEVNYVKSDSLKIYSEDSAKITRTRIDGDPIGTLPLEMKVIPKGLRVLLPSNT